MRDYGHLVVGLLGDPHYDGAVSLLAMEWSYHELEGSCRYPSGTPIRVPMVLHLCSYLLGSAMMHDMDPISGPRNGMGIYPT